MQISFLIVTHNRPEELIFTLNKLKHLIDLAIHEVLVCIDGCDKTELLINNFNWVKWTVLKKSVGASPARQVLYKKAEGTIFIGLDDDAHPVSPNFISNVEAVFEKNENLGVVAFQEIRGFFDDDLLALQSSRSLKYHFTNEFVGCGFAITKEAYNSTNGFPVWMDIYGEETAVSIEVLDAGYDMLYAPDIKVNHRVNVKKRKKEEKNYFRFECLLKNTMAFYLVYYSNPYLKIVKTLYHNFAKYALTDFKYFKRFFSGCFSVLFNLKTILKYRKPVKKSTLLKKQNLKTLTFTT